MSVGVSGTNRSVVVIGTITNRSPVTWKNVEIECRYFNSAGVLVDAKTQTTSLVILGHDEIAFRVETKGLRPEPDYATHRATVRYANNARTWP